MNRGSSLILARTDRIPQAGAEALGKPEAYITVSVTYNKTLTFAGTLEPAFALTVVSLPPLFLESFTAPNQSCYCLQVSLDNLSPEANEKYSKALSAFIKEKTGAPSDRGYMYASVFRICAVR